MTKHIEDVLALLRPEYIELDEIPEEFDLKPEEIAALGALASGGTDVLGETIDPETADAATEAKIKRFHKQVEDKPLPGSLGKERF